MKLAPLSALILLAACAPAPTTPSAFGPGAGTGVAGAQAAPPGASCRATLECYAAGEMSEASMQACDHQAGADDVALAHATMSCIAGSGCAAGDQDCVVQACATELTACTEIAIAPATPTGDGSGPAVGTGSFDLVYTIPAGWSEQRNPDSIRLYYSVADQWSPIDYSLIILPSQPLRGDLNATFHALWGEMVAPLFTPAFTPALEPAPVRKRLASGYPVAFDGEVSTVKSTGALVTAVLYLIASGDRVVPVLGMFTTSDLAKLEKVLAPFMDGVSISGAPPAQEPLFAPGDFVGEWSTQAAEYASWVDSRGNHVSDATIATRQDHTFRADGSYHAYAAAYEAGRGFDRESIDGTWTLEDDTLVIVAGGRTQRLRVYATAQRRSVKSLYLAPSYAGTSVNELSRPRTIGDWFGKVK